MIFWPMLYEDIIQKNYIRGYRNIHVLSGYASSSFVYHILHTFKEINLDLIIGMPQKENLSIWDHNEYVSMTKDTNRLRVRYYKGYPPIHAKIVLWKGENDLEDICYAGSANFTWNGFKFFQEIMVDSNPTHIEKVFPYNTELIDCNSNNVFNYFSMGYQKKTYPNEIDLISLQKTIGNYPYVILPLLKKNNEIHDISGLNWGQRLGREPNQAYIPIPIAIHKEFPNFFPNRRNEFSVITDDGESFVCVIAQENSKAIHSCRNNSILGKYFRKRLGIPFGTKVKTEHLRQYGRDSVAFYKINDETFYLDFSSKK
ncbi:restriction endonuclease PLD domain-containing protein [Brevibacillus laterosporus]|uniref:NgoFVII family restriction endonuclease n=1 Tax=Brevibacillus laterosporus TaxID=1465 RepID=A0AAP3DDT4_BRELA|nr:restriction endonuclease PLD domain-containing protein [Brevibacillus laterosporus]MCR8979389.1 NgoFVII family restriction endonuclease [Brevibacillus laterosporus]MCZ0806544.1 NgoFVII family restriction endonuclease [Brevibacillus laterosporus]MCZ0824992.1 NgoFVII family restriction endonuclease [Brevibacillus laterosporus]MCZ0849855.1 NgoFVII family restriction endonuclease [Brevibacillus laterosporus]